MIRYPFVYRVRLCYLSRLARVNVLDVRRVAGHKHQDTGGSVGHQGRCIAHTAARRTDLFRQFRSLGIVTIMGSLLWIGTLGSQTVGAAGTGTVQPSPASTPTATPTKQIAVSPTITPRESATEPPVVQATTLPPPANATSLLGPPTPTPTAKAPTATPGATVSSASSLTPVGGPLQSSSVIATGTPASVPATAIVSPSTMPPATVTTQTVTTPMASVAATATALASPTAQPTPTETPTRVPATPPPVPVPTLDRSGLKILDDPGIGGNTAIARAALRHYGEYYRPDGVPWTGWCEMYIGNVMDEAGVVHPRFASAIIDAINGPLYRGQAPAGSLVFFDQRANPYGHVGIALGDGTMLSALGGGIVRTVYADWVSYLGWRPYGTTAPAAEPLVITPLLRVTAAPSPDEPPIVPAPDSGPIMPPST